MCEHNLFMDNYWYSQFSWLIHELSEEIFYQQQRFAGLKYLGGGGDGGNPVLSDGV